MTVLKKMNSAATVTTRAVRRTAPGTTRARVQNLFAAAERRVDPRRLDEIGDWLLFAGVSLIGWLAAAIVFGLL